MDNTATIRLDYRLLCLVLAIALISLTLYTRPWESKTARTITVTGEATLTHEPDEFTFNPSYEKKAATAQEATDQVSKLGNEVVARLKTLGLNDKDITNSVTNSKPFPEPRPLSTGTTPELLTSSYSITAKTTNKEVAKKIQEYIATTPVLYQVTAQAGFSKTLEKKLNAQAQVKALVDAKTKAESQARALGLKVGKVISIAQPQLGGPIIYGARDMVAQSTTGADPVTPTFEIGSLELAYSTQIIFQLR